MSKFYLLAGIGLTAIFASSRMLYRAVSSASLSKEPLTIESERAKQFIGPFDLELTKREAELILGVHENSTPEEIETAYKRLIMLNNPDFGGSNYIASKIEESKELLTKKQE